jgi:uncharacterized membrane protein YdcZ (DUF606 family)
MITDFCTRTTRKIRRLGHHEKIARRFAGFFYVSMTLVCGLFGLFESPPKTIHANSCTGIHAAGARAGTIMPAYSGIR